MTSQNHHTHMHLPPPPLRSALKQPSRPSSPTGFHSLSPQTSRTVPLPATSSPAWTRSGQTPTPSSPLSRSGSSASLSAGLNSGPGASPISASGSPLAATPTAPNSNYPASTTSTATTTHGVSFGGSDSQHQSVAAASYTPKVSFDTFENPVASMFSFTLQSKTAGYKRTRTTRVFLCASSPDESGREALEWCLDSLVQDGDELIVFRGVEEDEFEKSHDQTRVAARALMSRIQALALSTTRKLSIILEYIPGKVTDSIDRLIALYRPDSLVVGTRGRRFATGLTSGLVQGLGGLMVQGLGGVSIGSVSKYCLSHSPVPVVVVRPGRKLKKAVEKRRADPKRGKHFEV